MKSLRWRSFFYFSNYSVHPDQLLPLMRIYYGFVLVLGHSELLHLLTKPNYNHAIWLWPVQWLSDQPYFELHLVFLGFIAFHAGAALWPKNFWFRLGSFASFFILMAANYSLGKIDHSNHGFLLTGFAFIFFDFRQSRFLHLKIKQIFWLAQMLFLLTYFLSGIWKLRFFFDALVQGQIGNFDPLAYGIASSGLEVFERFWPPVLDHIPHTGRLLLWALIATFEVALLFVAFKPSWQRGVGLAIVTFHIVNAYYLRFYFEGAAFLAVLLLVGNPYRRKDEKGPISHT